MRSTALRAMTDIDATLEQQIFDLPERQRIADVHHHSEADHLGRTVEVAEGIAHRQRLRITPHRLKLICSDKALGNSDYPNLSRSLTDRVGNGCSAFLGVTASQVPDCAQGPQTRSGGGWREKAMKEQAAVLYASGQPVSVERLDLAAPWPSKVA